jgi:ABC-type uncharacterized transport system involved in gliding motility auxiliary subunit
MKINRNLRFQMLAQSWLFVLLFICLIVLLGYLATQYRFAKDITQANRNILTQGSVNVLKQMQAPINVTVYATNDDANRGDTFRKGINDFMARYQREKKNINVKFINPSEEPKLAQEAGVKEDGELVVEYNKRSEHISPPIAEQEMTNLLVRLSRTNNAPVMFLDGHGERLLQGKKNSDIGEFGKILEAKGFKFANPDLTIAQQVPSNGSMLVIASPQVDVSEVEAKKIKGYIEAGGNVLWLLDDDNLRGLKIVADYIGIKVSPGIAVDMSAAQYGADAKIAFASTYGDHPITRNFQLRTLFPEAHEVDGQASDEFGWKVGRLVEVAPNGWLESDKVAPGVKNLKVTFDEKKDKRGPINVGVALERLYGKKGQRIVVMGNANFLSNTFITNGGNLDFGVNIVNWLAGDDKLITIQPMPLKDINVTIPSTDQGRMVAWTVFQSFQYFIPLAFFITGFWLWWKRRKA